MHTQPCAPAGTYTFQSWVLMVVEHTWLLLGLSVLLPAQQVMSSELTVHEIIQNHAIIFCFIATILYRAQHHINKIVLGGIFWKMQRLNRFSLLNKSVRKQSVTLTPA